mmetsp:Transcript_24558/g.84763  ORF Transcript_24558/g.84763 Transcript_24558/m.84763 type:complete len:124 (-) Transcript_24558:614-985(-)
MAGPECCIYFTKKTFSKNPFQKQTGWQDAPVLDESEHGPFVATRLKQWHRLPDGPKRAPGEAPFEAPFYSHEIPKRPIAQIPQIQKPKPEARRNRTEAAIQDFIKSISEMGEPTLHKRLLGFH